MICYFFDFSVGFREIDIFKKKGKVKSLISAVPTGY